MVLDCALGVHRLCKLLYYSRGNRKLLALPWCIMQDNQSSGFRKILSYLCLPHGNPPKIAFGDLPNGCQFKISQQFGQIGLEYSTLVQTIKHSIGFHLN